jgi:dihydroxyacid dehydratase/phosphogluconate dehydratase
MDDDRILIDIPARKLELVGVSDKEIKKRLERVKVVDRHPDGMLAKYRKLVSGASDGAICR